MSPRGWLVPIFTDTRNDEPVYLYRRAIAPGSPDLVVLVHEKNLAIAARELMTAARDIAEQIVHDGPDTPAIRKALGIEPEGPWSRRSLRETP